MAEEAAMSEIALTKSTPGEVSKPKPPASDKEINELLKRAEKGDKSRLPMVQALLADGDYGASLRESAGSPVQGVRDSLIEKAAGKHVMV
jgi:hypothetical protein